MALVILFSLGLILGSFANAVAWRIKSGESITHGRSMCPKCRHLLAAQDLVPVFSYILLKGKCRYCRAHISIQYPVIEVLTALIFAASSTLLASLGIVALSVWLLIVVCLMILAIYDAHWYELPNRVMHPTIIAAIVYFILRFEPTGGFLQLTTALITSGVFYALWRLSDGKLMGGADSKLVLVMGLILAPRLFMAALATAFMLGGIGAAYLLYGRKKGMSDQMPFGPYLIAGLLIMQLFGAQLLQLVRI